MKKIFLYSGLILAAMTLVSCGSGSGTQTEEDAPEEVQEAVNSVPEPVYEIVTNLGIIKIKLYNETPLHRDNFIKLASENFFDGIRFHRVINGFMIQAGDPLTKSRENEDRFGTGGPGYTIPAEILPQFWHKKGALAAARRGDAANPLKESSGSQFYIVQNEESCYELDGEYTIFGETIGGFDVIDRIAAVETDMKDCPVEDVIIVFLQRVQ